MKNASVPIHFNLNGILLSIAILWAGAVTSFAVEEDWGAYSLVPVSAPALVLEAVGAGTTDGSVLGVCLGGRDLDTLYAFCGDKIWKRKVKVHAVGAFTPWAKVNGTPL